MVVVLAPTREMCHINKIKRSPTIFLDFITSTILRYSIKLWALLDYHSTSRIQFMCSPRNKISTKSQDECKWLRTLDPIKLWNGNAMRFFLGGGSATCPISRYCLGEPTTKRFVGLKVRLTDSRLIPRLNALACNDHENEICSRG